MVDATGKKRANDPRVNVTDREERACDEFAAVCCNEGGMVDGLNPKISRSDLGGSVLSASIARSQFYCGGPASVRSLMESIPGERQLGTLLSLSVRLLSSKLLGTGVLSE